MRRRRELLARGVTELINDPAEEQAGPELQGRTLDAWSWIARAREAAARAVAKPPPAESAGSRAAGRMPKLVSNAPAKPDAPAD